MAKLLREFISFDQLEVIKESTGEGEAKKNIYKLKGPFLEAETKNKNGRTYPKDVLVREVEDFVISKIKKNRSMGELDHPECNLSKDFDVLTESGWKKFEDIKVGQNILTLNEDGNIEINAVENIIDKYYEGKAYHIKGRNIDSAFTPNHRFLLQDRYGKYRYVQLEDIYNDRKKYNKYKIVKTGNWLGYDSDGFIIPRINDDEYYSKCYWNFKNDVRKDLVIDTLIFVQFLGIWLSEGHISNKKYDIFITQNIGKNSELIENMLSKFPLEWNKSIQNNKVVFRTADIRLWNYLKKLGNVYTKCIPVEVKQLESIYLKELLDWFIMGDGRDQKNEDGYQYERKNLFSVSKKLVEDLHECLIKSGGSGNWTEHECNEDYIFADHLIQKDNKNTLYQLNISTTVGIYLDERFLNINEIYHKGNVYCLTVKNSNFYMKENNKCFWTGNSPQINLERVSHVIEELYMKDNTGMGVARLIDTPMGRIAETLAREGIMMGMSTRGVGSLDGDKVKEDYKLITVDIVADPSAPNCFVEGVLENKEYIIDGDQIVEVAIKKLRQQVDKKVDKFGESRCALGYMMNFLNEIRKK